MDKLPHPHSPPSSLSGGPLAWVQDEGDGRTELVYTCHIPGPEISPGPLAPEPSFPFPSGQALGVHVGRVGTAQGETLGVEEEQPPGVGSQPRMPQAAVTPHTSPGEGIRAFLMWRLGLGAAQALPAPTVWVEGCLGQPGLLCCERLICTCPRAHLCAPPVFLGPGVQLRLRASVRG